MRLRRLTQEVIDYPEGETNQTQKNNRQGAKAKKQTRRKGAKGNKVERQCVDGKYAAELEKENKTGSTTRGLEADENMGPRTKTWDPRQSAGNTRS